MLSATAALDLFVDQIIKRYNVSRVQEMPVTTVSSSSFSLDLALQGGFPSGAITEICGPPGIGKTTLALSACIRGQHLTNKQCIYLETEHKPIRQRAQFLGADFSKLLLLQNQDAQSVVDCLHDLVSSRAFWLVVVDSLASLTSDRNASLQDTIAESVIANAMPKLAEAAARTNTCILLLNQVRRDEGSLVHHGRLISPAHLSVAHHASVRVEFTKLMPIRSIGPRGMGHGTVMGHSLRATISKSCVSLPYLAPTVMLSHDRGIDSCLDILNIGCEIGLVLLSDTAVATSNKFTFQGFFDGRERLTVDPVLRNALEAEIRSRHQQKSLFEHRVDKDKWMESGPLAERAKVITTRQ